MTVITEFFGLKEALTLSDIPRVFTALAEWVSCLCYLFLLKKRVGKGKLMLISAVSGACMIIWLIVSGTFELQYWILAMGVAVILMCLFLWSGCKIGFREAIYFGARAFLLSEFMASFWWQCSKLLLSKWPQVPGIFLFENCLFVYVISFALNYFLEFKGKEHLREMRVKGREMIPSLIITVVAFALSNISFVYSTSLFSVGEEYSIFYVRTLVDFVGLSLLFAQNYYQRSLFMEKELNALSAVMHRQYEQYLLADDNMEMLKQEIHDLKHLIYALRTEKDVGQKEHYLEELESMIAVRESFINTGSSVLDTILTTKALYCNQNGIRFTCLGDGKYVEFMEVRDICNIFGNSLDNAIESVEKVMEEEKRLINVRIYQKNKLLMIEFENYVADLPKQEQGVLLTTKKNASRHGYGMKSIRMSAEKYDGHITHHMEGNWFLLRVLIPLK